MPRSRSLAALVAVVAIVAQACGSTASPSPAAVASQPAAAPASAPASAAAAPSAAEAVTLTLLEHQKPRCDVLTKVLPGFESAETAAGKNVKVNLVCDVVEDEAFRQKITLDYQGDSPPDVTSYPGAWVPGFATASYLLDITDRLNAWPDWSAHFYQVLRDRAQQADGKNYSMPRHGTVIEFFLRKDVLDANSISTAQPTSWDDLIARLKDLHAKTKLAAITIPGGKTWGGGTFDEGFIHIFNGTGGTLYDTTAKKWVVKSQGLTDAFNFYATLQSNGLLPTKALLDPQPWQPTKYDGFTGTTADGKTIPVAPPITTQGSWGWIYDWGPAPTGARPIPDLLTKVTTWAFPSKAPDKTFVWAAEDWMWTISQKSKHPDEAFDLLKYLNTGAPLAQDVAAVGNLAPRDDIQSIAPYASMPYLIAMEKLLPTGKSFKAQVGIDKIQQAVGDATEQILLNKMNGDKAAALFASEATDLLGPDAVESQ
jgi:multiple sugar transport system substrate-binding protein